MVTSAVIFPYDIKVIEFVDCVAHNTIALLQAFACACVAYGLRLTSMLSVDVTPSSWITYLLFDQLDDVRL